MGFAFWVSTKRHATESGKNTHQMLHQNLHFKTSLQKYVYYTPANTMIAPGSYMLNPSPMAANQTQPLATYYTYAGSVASPTSYVVHGATNGASNGITNPTYVYDQKSLAFATWNQNWGQNWTQYQVPPSLHSQGSGH